MSHWDNASAWYDEIEKEYLETLEKKFELEHKIYDLKSKLLNYMRYYNVQRINSINTKVSIVREHDNRIVDSQKLKNKYPSIYKECIKRCKIREHLQITIK